MNDSPIIYRSDKLGKRLYRRLSIPFEITGAKAASLLVQGLPVLETFDGGWSQATIDAFLSNKEYSSSSEFTAAQFDATSMGADAFGGLINMDRQIEELGWFSARCFSGTGGVDRVERAVKAGSLADSTLETAVELSSEGNLGFKIDFGNTPDFDALTSGLIIVEFDWISK